MSPPVLFDLNTGEVSHTTVHTLYEHRRNLLSDWILQACHTVRWQSSRANLQQLENSSTVNASTLTIFPHCFDFQYDSLWSCTVCRQCVGVVHHNQLLNMSALLYNDKEKNSTVTRVNKQHTYCTPRPCLIEVKSTVYDTSVIVTMYRQRNESTRSA